MEIGLFLLVIYYTYNKLFKRAWAIIKSGSPMMRIMILGWVKKLL